MALPAKCWLCSVVGGQAGQTRAFSHSARQPACSSSQSNKSTMLHGTSSKVASAGCEVW
jgi:hypothetical protein